jgi:transcriptional regulator with XRE-family HTH domain
MLKDMRLMRLLYGYTQAELAKEIKKSQKYYTQIETGKVKFSRLTSELANVLKVREPFLTSQVEYTEYPFVSNFYVFYLYEPVATSYEAIDELVCSRSSKIDAIFLIRNPLEDLQHRWVFTSVHYIALRDSHNTIFLVKAPVRPAFVRPGRKIMESDSIRSADTFRMRLHNRRNTVVYEKTIVAPNELENKIRSNTVTREDIAPLFPDQNFFFNLYQLNLKTDQK